MKFQVALINPRLRAWSPSVLVPLGLTYIAAVLEQDGHNVKIIDMNAEKISDDQLRRKTAEVDIVGITGMITEFLQVLHIVEVIKEENRSRTIILGGPLATAFPQDLLQLSSADFAVIGEGEATIIDLISAIKHGRGFADVKGIGYKEGDTIILTERPEHIADLDKLPFPARHLVKMSRYIENQFHNFNSGMKGFGKIKSTNMITSRGCPYSCTFCYKDMWGHTWRARSPENIIEEMEQLQSTYGINGFVFNDDTFAVDKKRVLAFCDLIKQRNFKGIWLCNGRINLMTREMLEAMHDAGCREIAYGIESGNQRMLDTLKKNITIGQIRDVVKWTKEAGICANGYFMIGLPGETREAIRQTIAFAEELDLDFYGFSLVTPLPGTELYQFAMESGALKDHASSLKDWAFDTNTNLTIDCTNDDLIAFKNEIFRKFTLKKFGRYYMFNPAFVKRAAKVTFSLQSLNEARGLAKKATGILLSHVRKV